MKSLNFSILAILLLVFALAEDAQAQVQKGDDIIGFSASVSTQSASPSSLNATVLLSYEKYITRNWAVGAGPYLTMITTRGDMTGIFGGNLFVNYGFLTNDGKLYPYLGVIGSISQSISSIDPPSTVVVPNGTPDKTIGTPPNGVPIEQQGVKEPAGAGNSTVSFFGAGAKAGAKYFVSERVNLDINVNYATNISSVVNGKNVSYGEGGILQVFLGIGVVLGRKTGE